MARLRLLGTGTCQLRDARAASSVLVERGDLRVVFDFGRGVARRLAELELRQDDIEHVVLSHFHPDHVSDLVPFLHAACWSREDPRTRALHLYGPRGLRRLVEGLLELFGEGSLHRPERFALHLHELEEGAFEIEGQRFEFRALPPAGNHGLAFSTAAGRCALTGDAHFHDGLLAFVRDAALAVVDAGHLTDEELVALAARAQPQTLVCSHLYRELDAAALQERAATAGYRGSWIVGRDGLAFEL